MKVRASLCRHVGVQARQIVRTMLQTKNAEPEVTAQVQCASKLC
jgi:hypothetical protein